MKTTTTFPRAAALVLSTLILVLGLAACASADYDIRGVWSYSLIDQNNTSTTYDSGTITFSGSPTKGTFREVNFYDVVYEGEYTVSGTVLTLTGDESWQGTVQDANTMSGTWSRTDGPGGSWSATRQAP